MKTQITGFDVRLQKMNGQTTNQTWNGVVFTKNRALHNFTAAADFAGLYYDGDDLKIFFEGQAFQDFSIGGVGYDYRLTIEKIVLESEDAEATPAEMKSIRDLIQSFTNIENA